MLPLILVSALALQTSPRDQALAARIPQLFHDVVILDDSDPKSKAAADEVRRLFATRGLMAIAEVGDEASYTFVLLACTHGPVSEHEQVLAKARLAVSRHEVPADAAAFCDAQIRQERLKQRAASRPPTQPALRDEINRLFVTDQAAREGGKLDVEKLKQADDAHEAPLTRIFNQYGVPTYTMVGPEAASQFAIMIQHQPAAFRKQVLPKLKANVDAGQADAGTYAMMFDRAAGDEGRSQRYGENFECNAQNPAMRPAPIEDEAHVNERRAFLGLMRLELLKRVIAEAYGPSPCSSLGAK